MLYIYNIIQLSIDFYKPFIFIISLNFQHSTFNSINLAPFFLKINYFLILNMLQFVQFL